MPRISKARLGAGELSEISDQFSYLVSTLSNTSEIENFLEAFLTKEEKLMLAKRLMLLMMIQKGYSPSLIQQALHISYESVRTHSRELHLKNELFNKTINKLVNRERSSEFWQKVEKAFKPIDLFMRSRSDMKARAKLFSGDLEDH